jgi:hypothetical protein
MGLFSCNAGQKEDFGIYLADTGELLLSEADIKAFHASYSTFELNRDGIEKWNSYITDETAPKLKNSLFSRDFIIKIEGRELCRGKFWSGLSSATCHEIVILDSLFILDETRNTLTIQADYPGSSVPLDDSIISGLIDYFRKHNLLE